MKSFADVLLGIAIGDAFGAGVEFQDRNWIRQHVDFTQYLHHRTDEESKNFVAGNYTDDTEMTIGLIKALIAGKADNIDYLVDFWTQEYELGKTTRGFGRVGHGSMRWFFAGEKSITDIRNYQRDKEYAGNAPPMRAVPLGFLPTEKINQYAIINADATHPHPKARVASVLVARATEFLLVLKDSRQDQLVPYCASFVQGIDAETEELLKKMDTLPTPSALTEADFEILCGKQPIEAPRYLEGIYGLPSDAMLTGITILYILKHARNAFDALQIAVNMGGDVDTIASVCCGVMAGLHGLDSLPNFLLEGVENVTYLKQIAQSFDQYLNL